MVWRQTLTNDRAAGIILKGDKILLMHRFNEGREYWVFPGGGVEAGETAEAALSREILEELNIQVKQKRFLFKTENNGRVENHFLITDYTGEPKLGGPEAIRMSQKNRYLLTWVPIETIDLLENFYPEGAREMFLAKWRRKEI